MPEGVLKVYLEEVRLTGSAGVAETSYYGAIKRLFDTVGAELKPKVTYILHPKSGQSMIPDGGLYLTSKKTAVDSNSIPDRGAVEVKPVTEDVEKVALSEQGQKYLRHYGHLLVTNLRHFALYRHGLHGPEKLDEIILAKSAREFEELLRRPADAEAAYGAPFREFIHRCCLTGVPLKTPQAVAGFLASYAREALRRAESAPDNPSLDGVRQALEEALGITFDDAKGRHFFLSTMVQTLFYGLFSGWVLWQDDARNSGKSFTRGDAIDYLRVPMVDMLFQNLVGPKALEPLGLRELLDRAVDVFNRIETGPFFDSFDEADAVQYFYEPFLAEFDPILRDQLGVWYTPKEIVRYQVKRVDQLLRNELGLPDGLADESVVVLDPCCGTGTYLVEVLAMIESRLTDRYGPTLAPEKIKQAALHRIFGFELIPAPYVVAHLQLGLLLGRKHAHLTGQERVQVYLTNALTGWDPKRQTPKQYVMPVLEAEREAAMDVKRQQPILVILGNPPYYGYAGISASEEERHLSDAYREVKNVPKPEGQGLNDLYVRFFRMAERRITEGEQGRGIISFISNYSWLDGLSHPGMRERFHQGFDCIWIDNLNGDKYATGKVTPEGLPDPSAFSTPQNREGIQVGTAIATLLRRASKARTDATGALVRHRHYWGVDKRKVLRDSAADESFSVGYETLSPHPKLGLPFKPRNVSAAYLEWPTLPELIPNSFPGVKTSRDDFLIDADLQALRRRINDYHNPQLKNEEIAAKYPGLLISSGNYDAPSTRLRLIEKGVREEEFRKYHYRPFDVRFIYWERDTSLLDRKRIELIDHHTEGELYIEVRPREVVDFSRGTVSKHIPDQVGNGMSHWFPLRATVKREQEALFEEIDFRRFNISDRCATELEALGAEDSLVFFHALATMHSPAYREANAGALRQDWPRIPWPADPGAIRQPEALRAALETSAALGRRIAALMDSETPVPGVTTGTLDPEIKGLAEFARLDGATGGKPNLRLQARWGYRGQGGVVMPATGKTLDYGTHLTIQANDEMGWHNVPRAVWEYKLGGYQVLKKWLSYREFEVLERDLLVDEVIHVTDTARRIAALIALGPELDASHTAVCAALE
jgi:hypothetical protein